MLRGVVNGSGAGGQKANCELADPDIERSIPLHSPLAPLHAPEKTKYPPASTLIKLSIDCARPSEIEKSEMGFAPLAFGIGETDVGEQVAAASSRIGFLFTDQFPSPRTQDFWQRSRVGNRGSTNNQYFHFLVSRARSLNESHPGFQPRWEKFRSLVERFGL
jgi:hypothetical protein